MWSRSDLSSCQQCLTVVKWFAVRILTLDSVPQPAIKYWSHLARCTVSRPSRNFPDSCPNLSALCQNRMVTIFDCQLNQNRSHVFVVKLPSCNSKVLNTLRTSDADLRFYITTVQDGWRKSAFLTRACFPCTIHLIMQYIERVAEWFCWRMFIETWPQSELTFRHRASSI